MAAILVVDDDVSYCDLLRQFLTEKGHSVLSANTAKSALELFKQHDPDIIISDVLMPEMDGIEFLLQLNKFTNKNLRGIIMISGGGISDADPYLNMAKSLGATHVFVKPVSLIALDEVIVNILK